MKMQKILINSLIIFALFCISDTRTSISPLFGQGDSEIITPANAFTLRQMQVLEYGSATESIAFSPNASKLASGHMNGEIRITALNGDISQVMYSGNPTIKRLVFDPDGTRLISSGTRTYKTSPNAPLYTTVQVWDTKTGTLLTTLIGDRSTSAKSISVSPNGHFVAVASLSGKFSVWMTGDYLFTLTADTDPTHYLLIDEWWAHGDDCSSVAFDPNGSVLACGGLDGTITLRQWNSFNEQQPITLRGHSHKITELAFSQDGLSLVSGDIYGKIRLWDIETGTGHDFAQIPSGLQGETDFRVAVSPNAQILAIVSTPRGIFSLNSESLIVRLWSTKTGDELVTLYHEEPVTDITFSSDGTRFASASWDGTVRLWGVP